MRPFLLALVSLLVSLALVGSGNACYCEGCGCKGGSGWRGPDGRCVYKKGLHAICGKPPGPPCAQEAAVQICGKSSKRPKTDNEKTDGRGESRSSDGESPSDEGSPSAPKESREAEAYIGILEPAETGRRMRLWFPDLPDCEIPGSTIEDLHDRAVAASQYCAKSWIEKRRELPGPRTVEQLRRDPVVGPILRDAVFLISIPKAVLEL